MNNDSKLITWRNDKLKSLPIEIIDGDRSARYPKRDEFKSEGFLFLNTTNIDQNRLDLEGANFVSREKFEEIKKGRLEPLDIVMTTRGSVGKVAIFDCAYRTGLINAQMLILRADGKVVDPQFLFYLFCSKEVQSKIRNFASGSAQPQIPIQDLREIDITYPPFLIQRKIAMIVSTYDDLINNNRGRIRILEEMTRAIYREWFVEFRAPGVKLRKATPPEKKATGADVFPEGWELRKLGDLADINTLSIDKDAAPESINYVDISSVSSGRIESVVSLLFDEAPGRARRIVRHGDVIWSCVRPNRKSYSLVLDPLPNLVVSTGFAVITARRVPYTYLYKSVTTDEFVGYLTNHATGAAYPAVKADDFEKATVVVPAQSNLDAFQEMTAPMFDLSAKLRRENDNLARTRDLLLPRLMSGEVSVESLEIATAMVRFRR